jgi:DNA anti-recombination protein RmuC
VLVSKTRFDAVVKAAALREADLLGKIEGLERVRARLEANLDRAEAALALARERTDGAVALANDRNERIRSLTSELETVRGLLREREREHSTWERFRSELVSVSEETKQEQQETNKGLLDRLDQIFNTQTPPDTTLWLSKPFEAPAPEESAQE